MMDNMSWGENPEYGPQAMVAHFDRDDNISLDFQAALVSQLLSQMLALRR